MNVECLAQELAAHLVLTRPLVCVDLEATGIWPGTIASSRLRPPASFQTVVCRHGRRS